MKSHTSEFKEEIKTLGKQQSVRITYKENNVTKTLTDEDINSATPNYEASLLKSVMKVLELDSNVSIPKGTEIKFEYGLLVNGAYEYLNYGNYIVAKEPEKQEDTLSYKITCYDKMLYSMKDYEHIEITYPCTIKEYLIALCNKIGLEFKDSTFANQDREIQNELFMTTNEDGTYSSMGYTYRDVLDQIAETTGGCICLTLDDKVEVRYVNKTINYEQSEKSNIIQFKTEVEEPIILERLEGKSIQDGASPSPDYPSPIENVEGKNIWNKSEISEKTQTVNMNVGELNVKDVPIPFTFSSYLISNALTNTNVRVSFTDSNNSNIGAVKYGNTVTSTNKRSSITINEIPEGTVKIKFGIRLQDGGHTEKTQLEAGTVATDYVPYNSLEIKDIGENLFDCANSKIIYNNGDASYKRLDNGLKIISSGTQYNMIYFLVDTVENLKGKTLTLSSDISFSKEKQYVDFGLYYTNFNGGNRKSFGIIESIKTEGYYTIKGIVEEGENRDYVCIGLRPNMDSNFAKGDYTIYDNLQVEIGETATPYKPYQEQKIDFPLSEGQKLYEGSYLADDGIHHKRKQVVFDGSDDENWQIEGTNNFYSNIVIQNSKSSSLVLCNYQKSTHKGLGESENCFISSSKKFNFQSDTINHTVADFKTWLSTHNLIVEYELAEPETVLYTAEQKTILTSIKTMKGTNIFEFPSDTIISYPINYDTIDEEYINDTNVNFGEKYGPINSIVLARAGESDKIYKKDQNSIDKNGLCELMIKENQFINFNDRVDYLQELSEKLFGVEYYLNDFVSTGIMYYDLLDVYNVKIGDKTYNCLMLNDEQDITQGLEENIYTERPEKSETDYTKADKTDQKINQTNLVVDKQNQKIEGVISQIGDRSEKTTTITADIDGLNSKVSQLEDVTNETTSTTGILILENCQQGPLLNLKIFGNNTVFKYLYPSDTLYPSNTLYPYGDSRIVVTSFPNGSETGISKIYELGVMDVLRQKGNIRDEFIIEQSQAKVIRRINKDGSIKDNEEIEELGEIHIDLEKGKNVIQIQNYTAEMYCKYAIQSEYTDVFATKVEMNSEIKQTASEINLEVSKKVNETELGTKIVQNFENVKIAWNKITEFIQMMILNGNASLAILDNSKKILMSLDKTGQHFYDSSENKIGDVGVINYKNTPMIAFNLNVSQNNNKRNGLGNRKKWNILSDFLYCRNIL